MLEVWWLGGVLCGTIRKLLVCSPHQNWFCGNTCLVIRFGYLVSAVCLEIAQCFVPWVLRLLWDTNSIPALLSFFAKHPSGRTADTRYQLAVERNLGTDGVSQVLNSPFLLPCILVLAVACLIIHSPLQFPSLSGSGYEKKNIQEYCLINLWWYLLNKSLHQHLLISNKTSCI